ncbi:hypothetical protein GCM10010306_008750 [Streptomyces umbrinus]|uniref:effector-associated constant component EACC1 n=1 Tax=Streptomyces umbrinus TaxID=67370 RepID=UPI00167989AC|nr:hypothetical protein [Streptomyces umbrinus]GHB18719.1 hypothetical protein GCM10010306_008750 [Streptomyces umbrinus]
MRIQVLAEGDEQGLADLHAWLGLNPGTAALPVKLVASDTGRTMGVLEALDVVLGNATNIANFAVAYATWRSSRPDPTRCAVRTLVHGSTTLDIGHLPSGELAQLLRNLNDEHDDGGNYTVTGER